MAASSKAISMQGNSKRKDRRGRSAGCLLLQCGARQCASARESRPAAVVPLRRVCPRWTKGHRCSRWSGAQQALPQRRRLRPVAAGPGGRPPSGGSGAATAAAGAGERGAQGQRQPAREAAGRRDIERNVCCSMQTRLLKPYTCRVPRAPRLAANGAGEGGCCKQRVLAAAAAVQQLGRGNGDVRGCIHLWKAAARAGREGGSRGAEQRGHACGWAAVGWGRK